MKSKAISVIGNLSALTDDNCNGAVAFTKCVMRHNLMVLGSHPACPHPDEYIAQPPVLLKEFPVQ